MAVVYLLAFASTGCSQTQVQIFALVEHPVPLSAVLVEVVNVPQEPSSVVGVASVDKFEASRRTHALLRALYEHTPWRVIGPGRFSIRHPDREPVVERTDIVLRVARDPASLGGGLDPETCGYLTVNLGRRHWKTDHEGRQEWRGAVNIGGVLRAADGSVIMDARVEMSSDPFAEKPDYDSEPEIDVAIDLLVGALAERCAGCVAADPHPPYSLRPSPAAVFEWTTAEGGTLRQTSRTLDPLEAEDLVFLSMQYIWPQLSARQAQAFGGTFAADTRVCLGEDSPQPGFCAQSVLAHGTGGEEVALHSRHQLAALWARNSVLTLRGWQLGAGRKAAEQQPVFIRLDGRLAVSPAAN